MQDRKLLTYRLNYLLLKNPAYINSIAELQICPFCSCHLSAAAVKNHLKKAHKEELLKALELIESQKSLDEQGIECPLCHQRFTSLTGHITRGHNMTVDSFRQLTGYKGELLHRSQSLRQTASKIKADYYKTPEGQAYKKLQHAKMTGDNNPAKRLEVRQKISRSCMGRPCSCKAKETNSLRGVSKVKHNQLLCRGYFFKLIYNGEYYYARSLVEFKVLVSLLINNIKFNEEFSMLQYYNTLEGSTRYYLPDFVVGSTVYETKATKKEFETSKYRDIGKTLKSIGYDFKFLNISNFKQELNVLPVSKVRLEYFIKEHLNNHTLHIVPPTSFYRNSCAFLKQFLGDNYESLLKINEEKFNENKENL